MANIAARAPGPELSETALRSLLDRAPDGIFVADMDGRYTYVNSTGCRMLGYRRDELIGMSIMDLIPANDVPRLLDSRQAMLDGITHAAEWTLRRKDGSAIPVEVSANILPDGQWQGFVRDISERKAHQAERQALFEQLNLDKATLQTVLDALPLGVQLFDATGKVSANRHAEDLLGIERSASAGIEQYASRLFFPDGRPVPSEKRLSVRAMRGGKAVAAEEYLIRQPDGRELSVLAGAAPVRDAKGRTLGAVCVFQDVSERMRLARAARENELLLKAVIDLLPVGVWVADANGRVTLGNPAGDRIWNGILQVGPGQFGPYKGWWVESGRPVMPDEWALTRAIRHGETSRSELIRIQCFDGSFRTVMNWGAPIRSASGEITGAVAVNEDLTALHQTQESLRAAIKDREDILAVVTHDLRNPLGSLQLMAANAEYKAGLVPGGEAFRAIAASMAEVTRGMAALVEDLLAIAVTAPGRSLLKLAPVEASLLLEKATHTAQPLFARKGIELEVQRLGEIPPIDVDADRILRVLANLLDNALKFTEPPGKTVMRVESLSSDVRFCVANSGPPLAAADLEHMFQPFWQAARHDRRGAGLGLSICRSIVEAHGGTLWAEPALGMRVRICMLLPRVHAAPGDGMPQPPPQSG